jgi:Fe-S-cluster-containing dehydrogenase component
MTGSKADQWIPTVAGGEGLLALALAAAVYSKRGDALPGDSGAVRVALRGVNPQQTAASAGVPALAFDALVKQVLSAKSAVALPPGVSAITRSGTSDSAAVLLLNALLGAVDKRVKIPVSETAEHGAPFAEIQKLIAAMKAGRVNVLLMHDTNPAYSLPADSGFKEALEKVGLVVSFSSMKDETSELADLILPDHSAFESWGDAHPRDGVRSLIQPTIRPLWDTQGLGDSMLAIGRGAGAGLGEGNFLDRLKAAWSDVPWRATVAAGAVFSTPAKTWAEVQPSISRLAVGGPAVVGSGDYTLVAYPHSFMGDGSSSNLPWMQEIPDPVGRVSWMNYLEVSKGTAAKLGVSFGDVVEIATGFGEPIHLSVYPRGGIQDDVIAISIGQGHTVGHYASLAGDGRPGVARGESVISILPAATDESGGRAWVTTRASLKATGQYQRVPLSQFTDNQRGRELAPKVSLVELAAMGGTIEDGHDTAAPQGDDHGKSGGEAKDVHHEFLVPFDTANDAHPDSEYRWSMSIDNDKCNGCGACVAACYTENSVSIVGQEGMARHREMSWLRIERYVDEGDTSDGEQRRPHPDREALGKTDVRYAPMLCQQCGAAPCEAVCPVIATYHTPEGLNAMIYNRCVGTSYCANNCVYKVRRFNYFDYSRYNWPGLMNLMLNPDVTARQQGVMEKCTFCVQRIQTARQTAKDEKRPIADGEVVTACQQTCPTQAIQFGNAKDKQSTVVKTGDDKRAYHSLHVLNTRSAITYLAQVERNDDERSHG